MRFFVLVICMILAGCSAHTPTVEELKAHQQTEISRAGCYAALARMKAADAQVISSVPDGDREMVALVYLMQKNNIELVAAATGNQTDLCGASNLFDSQIAETKAKNKAAENLTGRAFGIVPWVVGGLTLNALADKMGESTVNAYSATDNARINVNSKNQDTGNAVGGDMFISGDNHPDNSSTCDDCETDETDGGAGMDTIDGPDVELEQCLANPPGGFSSDGVPLYRTYPACSCHGHYVAETC